MRNWEIPIARATAQPTDCPDCDAFGFLTRVFVRRSVGSAQRRTGADAVDAALGAATFPRSVRRVRCAGLRGVEAMRKLVYAFYNHAFSFRVFITEFPQLKAT